MSAAPAPTRRSSERGGFSLVEILCAVLVLGLALTGLAEGITRSLRAAKEAEYATSAVLLAAGRMETLRAEADFIAGEESGDFGESFPLYAWRQSITETGLRGLYRVRIDVVLEATEASLYQLEALLFQTPIASEFEGGGTETSTERRRRRAAEGRDARGAGRS